MEKKFRILENKIDFVIIIGFILLPIILHLNEINLRQYNLSNIIHLFTSQIILSLIVFILSLLIIFLFFKKFFFEILICNFVIFYLSFYYIQILNLENFRILNSYYYLLDNIFTLLIYIVVYLIIFFSLIKYKKGTKIFFLYLVILNLIFGVYNMSPLDNSMKITDMSYESSNKIDLESIKIPEDKKKTNVYLIILDGMMNLEKAEKEKVISSKNKLNSKLEQHNFSNNSFFNANYHWTYVSIKSLLYGDYPVTEESPIYKNRKHFFSYIMSNKENFFYQIINKLDMNFFWIGNEYEPCNGTMDNECFYNYKNKSTFIPNLIFTTDNFYKNSIFSYLYYYFLNDIKKDSFVTAYEFLENSQSNTLAGSKKNNDKANFYLIHVLKPHDPYDLDQNCNKIQKKTGNFDVKKYYSYNYKCVLEKVLKWEKEFLNNEDDNIVIILGDHGWKFHSYEIAAQEYFSNSTENIKARMNDVFFAYKLPKKCNSIEVPNSHVNVMRFILKCLEAYNPEYLENKQYITRHEGDKDYGKTTILEE